MVTTEHFKPATRIDQTCFQHFDVRIKLQRLFILCENIALIVRSFTYKLMEERYSCSPMKLMHGF